MNDRIKYEVVTNIPTKHGMFKVLGFQDTLLTAEHMALISGMLDVSKPVLVRIHSECVTGEALGSIKCECGPQLDAALEMINAEGGMVIYLRGHEGRGIGLINKLKAYALQENGLDTVEANVALGFPDELRDFYPAVAILEYLKISKVRLLTNNPAKQNFLTKSGIEVTEQVPLIVGVNPSNIEYLKTKASKMGHIL